MSSAFWPYEEIEIKAVNTNRGLFELKAPWLKSSFSVAPQSPEYEALVQWISAQDSLDPKHLAGLWKVFDSLQALPVAYELPRSDTEFGTDTHKNKKTFVGKSPKMFAKEIGVQHAISFSDEWTWDAESIQDFAECDTGKYDPLSVLSVVRRFYYIDDDSNQMTSIYKHIHEIKDDKARKLAAATVLRQNHYVTEKSISAMRPALDLAQSKRDAVEDIMRAEKGHDAILGSGIRALNVRINDMQLTPSAVNLMQLLEKCAFHNFLAFCIAMDFFEKPAFKDQVVLSEVLAKLGEATTARALQAHKNINDIDGTKAIARSLLVNMKSVDAPYLLQALQLSELASKAIIMVSHELTKIIIK